MTVKKRDLPVFSYKTVNGRDHWSVAQSALGQSGSRWLPVRNPADYSAEVFRAIARQNGIRLPAHKIAKKPISGTVIATWQSGTVRALAKSMLKYSTNMTAETLGLSASMKRKKSVSNLRASGQEMTKWLTSGFAVKGAKFVDHSGLGSDSRISADQMARFLVRAKWDGPLRPMMKEIILRDVNWKKAPIAGATIKAKTGTLNFASALAGYIHNPNGRKLAFAIFTADMKKRGSISKKDREKPQGAKFWARKSRVLQHQLLRHWIKSYGG